MSSLATFGLFLIAAFALPARSVSQTPRDIDTREVTQLEHVSNQAHVAGAPRRSTTCGLMIWKSPSRICRS